MFPVVDTRFKVFQELVFSNIAPVHAHAGDDILQFFFLGLQKIRFYLIQRCKPFGVAHFVRGRIPAHQEREAPLPHRPCTRAARWALLCADYVITLVALFVATFTHQHP